MTIADGPEIRQPYPVVYLAGGMRSGWQDMMPCGPRYLDPRSHGLTNPDDYTAWDLRAIGQCDVLFGYMEESNPSLYGLCLEVGYAKALGKRIILVDGLSREHQMVGHLHVPRARYFGMVRSCSNVVSPTLMDGIRALDEMCQDTA